MSKRDMKTALRAVSRAETSDRFDVTAAQMVSVRERSGLIDVLLEHVQPNPDQPRRQFDPAGLEELAASLRTLGVLQPILVRRQGEKGYVIVAGERRWRAAQLAGLATIPAIVRTLDDNATLEAALTENLQREDLAPWEEAQLFQRMVDELGYSIRRLADRLGKGKGYIEDRLRLTRMDADLQALVSGRPDTLTHVREIDKVADPAERAALIAEVRENALPLQEVRRRIREATLPPELSVSLGSKPENETPRPDATSAEKSGRPDNGNQQEAFPIDVKSRIPTDTNGGSPSTPATFPEGEMMAMARQMRHQIVALMATDTPLEPIFVEEMRALSTSVQNLLRQSERMRTAGGPS